MLKICDKPSPRNSQLPAVDNHISSDTMEKILFLSDTMENTLFFRHNGEHTFLSDTMGNIAVGVGIDPDVDVDVIVVVANFNVGMKVDSDVLFD